MTPERYRELELDYSLTLTKEEIEEGWHFCLDWDQMLVHKDSPEAECCTCPGKRLNNG